MARPHNKTWHILVAFSFKCTLQNVGLLFTASQGWIFLQVRCKTFPENWDSKVPSVGTLLAYLETTTTETFGICLKKNFVKPHNISTQSDNETMYTKYVNKNCLDEFLFEQMLKVSAFYLEKQKSLIPKKI